MRVGLVLVFLDIYVRVCLYLCIFVYIRLFTSSSVLCLQVQPSARSAGPQVEGFDAYAHKKHTHIHRFSLAYIRLLPHAPSPTPANSTLQSSICTHKHADKSPFLWSTLYSGSRLWTVLGQGPCQVWAVALTQHPAPLVLPVNRCVCMCDRIFVGVLGEMGLGVWVLMLTAVATPVSWYLCWCLSVLARDDSTYPHTHISRKLTQQLKNRAHMSADTRAKASKPGPSNGLWTCWRHSGRGGGESCHPPIWLQ